ncbi:hypothetical protein [Nocardia yamanashiensis]|uniref:hypothetical protein n=1 Tax=Nocardia yamanashiensis TaxID=209247 RepID=UPI00082D7F53|nr:hypothetical protein [Nocardia yamanashiensis]
MSVNTFRAPASALLLALIAYGVVLHRGWIVTKLWLLALPLLLAIALVLITLFVVAVWRAGRHPSPWPLAITSMLTVLGIAGPAFLATHLEASAWTRFWLERPAFAAIAHMEVPPYGQGDYYGTDLPAQLCFVSAMCKVAVIGTSAGHPVRFVPDYVGIPDDAFGYGHFIGKPDPGPYDGFGAQICPTMELAGGWWWLDYCG